MVALLALALNFQKATPAEEVWIGNYKTAAGTFTPHAYGTTQELTLRPDGTCRIVTRNHHLVGATMLEVTREGTYTKDKSTATFELVKDGVKTKHVAQLQPSQMAFSGSQAPFTFSNPTIFTPAKAEPEIDGKYKLTLYNKTDQRFVTFPRTLTIAGNGYTIADDQTPNTVTERGAVTMKKLATGKPVLSFKSDARQAILNGKTWINLYHGEVWTVPQSLAVEFPAYASNAAGFDLILMEKQKPAPLP